MEFLSFIAYYKQAFECNYNLLKKLCLKPLATVSCKRSFSSLTKIKSYLKTTMTNEILSNIGILRVEKGVSKWIDFNEDKYASLNKNRRTKLV